MSLNQAPPPTLRTERLTLRQLLHSDDNEIFALRTNEEVNRYLDRAPSQSIGDAQKFIQIILQNQSLYWAITLTGNNTLIGTVCLFDLSDNLQQAEIGYELLPEFQSKGIMQEALRAVIDLAFQHLRLNSLTACTQGENKASLRLLEKLNFAKQQMQEDNLVTYILNRKR